ncbi:MAG: PHB depolymerase family esterase, partial [Myxococcota bacterium]
MKRPTVRSCMLAWVVVVACGDDPNFERSGTNPETPVEPQFDESVGVANDDESASPGDAATSPPCGAAGEFDEVVDVDGYAQSFRLKIPENLAPGAPVIVQLHGALGSIEKMENVTDLPALAESEGFVLATPLGAEVAAGLGIWNAGACCGAPETDHVAALSAVIERTLERASCLDEGSVFVAGQSNGAMMAYRLACQVSDRLAGIITNAGYLANQPEGRSADERFECANYRPLPILHIHGLQDPLVPYGGNALGQP